MEVILKKDKNLSIQLYQTQFEYNILKNKVTILKTEYPFCTYCKKRPSVCAVKRKFEISNEFYERPVCYKCVFIVGGI